MMPKLSPEQIKQIKLMFEAWNKAKQLLESKLSSHALPPVTGEIVIPEKTSASQLAALLGQKTFQIIADIMELRIMAFPSDPLSFEIISKVARKYGFFAIKAGY